MDIGCPLPILLEVTNPFPGDQTRAWAVERFGALDAPQREEIAVQWRVYDFA